MGALPGSLCQQQQQGSPGWSLVFHLMQDTGWMPLRLQGNKGSMRRMLHMTKFNLT